MLAVGVWSAMALRRPLGAPLAFAASLLVGAVIAMRTGWAMPALEASITVSLAVLGLLVALRTAMPWLRAPQPLRSWPSATARPTGWS